LLRNYPFQGRIQGFAPRTAQGLGDPTCPEGILAQKSRTVLYYLKHQDKILTFLDDPDIHADNNRGVAKIAQNSRMVPFASLQAPLLLSNLLLSQQV
jgi:hypothetical protein